MQDIGIFLTGLGLGASGGAGLGSSSIAAVFNNGTVLTGGMTLSYARNYAISTIADGTIAAVDTPVYDDVQTFAGAPNVTTMLTDATATIIPASGIWSDGISICDVIYQQKSAPNPAYVNIFVGQAVSNNAYGSNPARSVNIRCAATGNKTTNLVDLYKGGPDESADTVDAPVGFTVVQGTILALCNYQKWTGSAWQVQGISAGYWDEANSRWRLLYRTRAVNAGQNRGREWVNNQYWIMDGQTVESSREVFVAWIDYQNNPGGTGGQLLVTRLSRASASAAWTIGNPVLLYEESAITPNRHYHNASARRYGASGVEILLYIGDSSQSECIGFYRSDSSQYDQGWDSGTGTPTASTTDGATSNGWTTKRKVAGCPTTLSSSPAVGWPQTMCYAALPGTDNEIVISNDEGQQPVLKMIMPDFANGNDHVRFETVSQPLAPSSLRRGWLNFALPSDPSNRRYFASVAYRNSAAQASTGAHNEVYRLAFTEAGSPSGTFTLSIAFGGGTETTLAIVYSSTAATIMAAIDTALEALASMGAGTISVAQFSGTNYDVTFTGSKASTAMPIMTINTGSLVNVTATCTKLITGSANKIPCSLTGTAGGYPQGFSGSVSGETARLLASNDGTNWFEIGAPNSQVRIAVRPDGYVLCGGIAAYGKLNAYKFPVARTVRPLRISPGSTNQQISTLTTSESPTTGNTWATIDTSTQLGVADGLVTGRTIPRPPCNGPVRRWTVSGSASSKYGGVYTVTTGNPLVAATTGHRYVKLRLWVYMLPTSNPYGGDNVAPYNSPRCPFRVQLLRGGSSAASFAAWGDVDSMDGSGWVPITLQTYTDDWASYISAATNLSVRFTDNSSGATNMDALIAFDCVQISSTPDDLCVHPAPVGASASAMGHDTVTIDDLPINFGEDWTIQYLTTIPKGGWDQFVPINYRPTNPRLFTLYQDVSSYIYCRLDPVNRRVVLGDDFGSVSISPPSGEEFVFLPGDQVYVAISASGTALNYAVSVGGTQVKTGTFTLGGAVAPMQCLSADNATAPISAHNLYKMDVKPKVAYSTAQLTTALQRLAL